MFRKIFAPSLFLVIVASIGCCSAFAIPISYKNVPRLKTHVDTSTNDDKVRAFVAQMSPAFVFHPAEKDFCTDAAKSWQQSRLRRKDTVYEPSTNKWLTSSSIQDSPSENLPLELSFATEPDDFLAMKTSHHSAHFDPNAPLYCEFWNEGDYIQVKYWYWSSFNDHPKDNKENYLSHEGDWEHVEMRAHQISANEFEFFYYLNQHGHPHLVIPNHWINSDNDQYKHPKFWIGLGGHAPYEEPKKTDLLKIDNHIPLISSASTILDEIQDSNYVWPTWQNLQLKNDNLSSPVWTFRGYWGNPECTPVFPLLKSRVADTPRGPNTRTRFFNSDGAAIFP